MQLRNLAFLSNPANAGRHCFSAVADMLMDAAAVLGGQETLRLLAQPLLQVIMRFALLLIEILFNRSL